MKFSSLVDFRRDDEGSTTILALYFTMIFLVMGGVSVDFMKLMQTRTKLQIATDSVAQTALYTRDTMSASEARAAALAVAEKMLPASVHGDALTDADIVFGTWDYSDRSFTADNTSRNAVRVDASRLAERSNGLPNLILRMIGFDTFDIARTTIFTTYNPACFREGLVAEEPVTLQSNNSFSNGFCIHSNKYVSLNNGNSFEPGTVVSMPDTQSLSLPQSGFEPNSGLDGALRTGVYRLRIINRIEEMVQSLAASEDRYKPSYILGTPTTIFANRVSPLDFTPGRHHRHSCNGGRLTFEAGTYSNFLLTSNCAITFAQGVVLTDAVVSTSNTSATSIRSPNGLQIGRDDDCGPGGGAIVITLGGVSVAAGMQMYGGQILAKGDVDFAANADGMEGTSIVSGGRITGSSNASMAFCGRNMDVYEANYFRMAM